MDFKKQKTGFSLAEALVTLMIVSAILAATMPVIVGRNLTTDSMWRYVTSGTGSNSNIFYGLGDSQTAIIGSDSVPANSSGSRLILVTPPAPAIGDDDTIKHSLIEFWQKTPTSANKIGRIAFDKNYNIAIGDPTLQKNSKGGANTAIGSGALFSNTEGYYNTAIGLNSLYSNTTGSNNIAIGFRSLSNNKTGYRNIAYGSEALSSNTTGFSNIAIGNRTLFNNTISNSNIAIGDDALYANTTGMGNIAIGGDALYTNTTARDNIALGYTALHYNKTGSDNTATGDYSLYSNTTGGNNVANGNEAMKFIDGASSNTAVGAKAMESIQGASSYGSSNVAVGYAASNANTSGDRNTAIGSFSLMNNTTGSLNTIVGHYGAVNNTEGYHNSGLGVAVFRNLLTGYQNSALGYDACSKVNNGYNNLCLGYFAGPTRDQNNKLYINIGESDYPLIGGDFAEKSVKINGSLTTTGPLFTPTGSVSTSDLRLKNVGKEYKIGLEKILQLNVKEYTFKSDKTKRKRIGVIAQELQKVIPQAIIQGPGNDKYKSLLYVDTNELGFTMINAIKQLYQKIVAINNRINKLEVRLQNQDKVITELEKENSLQQQQISILKQQNAMIQKLLVQNSKKQKISNIR